MSIVLLIGRILLGAIFIGSGFGHLMQTEGTAAYAESRGLKNPKALVQLSGVLILAGGLGVILGVWMDLAALGLAIYTFVTAFMIHHFWTDQDPMTQQSEMTQFMKNMSITGGLLILFVVFGAFGDELGMTITGPIFEFNL